jgi:hypothetical protein
VDSLCIFNLPRSELPRFTAFLQRDIIKRDANPFRCFDDLVITATEIEVLYSKIRKSPFPYDDCFWLVRYEKRRGAELIPDLDLYFSNVHGYASGATRLGLRSDEELEQAKKTLSTGPFETYPHIKRYQHLINPEKTPRLLEEIETTEQMRIGLLELLRTLEASPELAAENDEPPTKEAH